MKIQTIMYRDLFGIEMKPKFCNEMRLASKLCSPHYPQIIFSHYLYHIIIFSAKHRHCSYIVLIGIVKTLRGDKFKKAAKKGVLKENNCGKILIFFYRSSPSGSSQISDSYEEGSQQCERQADNT